ncbi:MAG TPA: methyltransferase [Syntrophales bacterium]|nr:methyltransferase [Syntrophales bacterium]
MEKKEWNLDKLLALSGYYWKSFTLHAAIKLGIFTVIGTEQLTGEEITQRLSGEKRGVTPLLNALSAMNLIAKKGNKYFNTPASISYLSKDSPEYIGYMIMHHHHLAESWSKLDKAIRTGRPVRSRSSHLDEEVRESFLMGMFNNAMNLAPRLINVIDLSGRRHLLDVGGGPGTYAINFCLHNPQLKATVYDLPTTRPYAARTIEKFGLSARIDFTAGDYLNEDIPGSYDVAWLSQILHAEGPKDCQKIIDKTVSVLEPGGMIIVHEFILDNTMDSPLFPALFSLNMLLGTANGRSYSESQIMEMLARAGVKEIKRITIQPPSHSGIVKGVV